MKFILILLSLACWTTALAESRVPTREISVIVTKEGYYPKNFTVFQGEKIKFYVTATVDAPDCLVIQGHKVFMSATKGKISEGETVFDTAGTFAFYCPATKHDGTITVIKKADRGRVIAGETDPALWVPKEYE